VVLLVARLRWEKGLREFAQVVRLVEAARRAAGEPVPCVLAVGDGPARAGFQALLPDARFTGTLTGEALAAVYASADVFLYPSTTEGWGGTCLEAQVHRACPLWPQAGLSPPVPPASRPRGCRSSPQIRPVSPTWSRTARAGFWRRQVCPH